MEGFWVWVVGKDAWVGDKNCRLDLEEERILVLGSWLGEKGQRTEAGTF